MKTQKFKPELIKFETNSRKIVWLIFDDFKYNFSTIVNENSTYEDLRKFFVGSKHNFDKEIICKDIVLVYESNKKMIEEISSFMSGGKDELIYNCLYIKNEVIHCNNGQEIRYYDLNDLVTDEEQLNNLNNKVITNNCFKDLALSKGLFFDENYIVVGDKNISWCSYYFGKIRKNRNIYITGKVSNYKEYIDKVPFRNMAGDEITVY